MSTQPSDSDRFGEMIRAAAAEVRAPEPLRERVDAQRAARGGFGFPLLVLAGAAAVLAVSAVLVLAVGLFGGDRIIEGPTLARAADAALRPPVGRAPAEDAGDPVQVRAGIAGLRFPYWDDQFGLDAVASRRDVVGSRSAMTVLYAGRGGHVGYTIVDGPPLAIPAGAQWINRGKISLALFMRGRARVVTWRRAGHTCVLASRDASATRLLSLAAWTGDGGVGGYGR
jgi:hypothetical protein